MKPARPAAANDQPEAILGVLRALHLDEDWLEVATLAEPFDMSSPAISKHLRVLERAGLVAVGRSAQSRPRRLVAKPLAEATEWLAHYRPFWESTLDNLDDYVRQLKAKRKAPAKATRKPLKARSVPRSKR